MRTLTLKAHGKINLGLDVLRRREDGYHEVRMIMQTVGLSDILTLSERNETGIVITAEPHTFLPLNENNLAYKGASLLMEEFGIRSGLAIHLEKHIPIAAGMAGGSSDCAAVMYGVNRLFHLGLSLQELQERGVKIGADVPYCLMRGTALAENIGEKLSALPAAPDCEVLLAKPPVGVSTKWVYTNLKASELPFHPDIDAQIEAIREGDRKKMAETMGNVLETVTVPAHPVIGTISSMMKEDGALGAMMSGSGPTVFGLFEDKDKAEYCRKRIRRLNLAHDVICTHFFNVNGDGSD